MIGIIVQARTGSTRFPGKVLQEVRGQSILWHLIHRLARVRLADTVIVGTTDDPSDDPVAEIAGGLVSVYRWPTGQQNILAGFLAASRMSGLDVVVRVTADCPLLDPATCDLLIARFLMGDVDHVEAMGMADGTWCEVLSLDLLERIARAPDLTDEEREHVTLHARRRPSEFRLGYVDLHTGLENERWVVDTPEDFVLVGRVMESLSADFRYGDVARLLREHPEWLAVNAAVPRTPLEDQLYRERVLTPTAP